MIGTQERPAKFQKLIQNETDQLTLHWVWMMIGSDELNSRFLQKKSFSLTYNLYTYMPQAWYDCGFVYTKWNKIFESPIMKMIIKCFWPAIPIS